MSTLCRKTVSRVFFIFLWSAFLRSCVTFAYCLTLKNLVSNPFKARFFASCKLSRLMLLCSLTELKEEEHRLLLAVSDDMQELCVRLPSSFSKRIVLVMKCKISSLPHQPLLLLFLERIEDFSNAWQIEKFFKPRQRVR